MQVAVEVRTVDTLSPKVCYPSRVTWESGLIRRVKVLSNPAVLRGVSSNLTVINLFGSAVS